MTGDRSRELDILKAFGIFLMIFDHVGWGDLAHTYIQSFHMPLFFIVSGYLWKPNQSISRIAQRRFKTVMVPYFSFAVLYLLILASVLRAGLTDRSIVLALRAVLLFPTDMQNMPFAPALWFLPCFYLCNLIYSGLFANLPGLKISANTSSSISSTSAQVFPRYLKIMDISAIVLRDTWSILAI